MAGTPLKEAAADALQVAATAATAALSAGRGPTESGLLAAAAAILVPATKGLAARRERRQRIWITEYIRAEPCTDPELLEAKLYAEGNDPLVQEVIIEAARGVEECLADAVVPPLARLTRQYVPTRKPADAFFRGMRRLLSDLGEEEFAAFRDLLGRIFRLPLRPQQLVVEIMYTDFFSKPDAQLIAFKTPDEGGEERLLLGPYQHSARMFHLLKANYLAGDSTNRWGSSPSFGLDIGLDDVQRIYEVVR